jgi:hypothetical protein
MNGLTNSFQVLLTALGMVMSGVGVVTVKDYTVTASLAASPVHFSLAAALLGVSKVYAGQTGTFQCGDVMITVTKNA